MGRGSKYNLASGGSDEPPKPVPATPKPGRREPYAPTPRRDKQRKRPAITPEALKSVRQRHSGEER